MKIGVLTSSRADFGIYLPLLKELKEDSFFQLEVIAFGTHLSRFHGYTLSEIAACHFDTVHTISSLLTNDNAVDIATAYGLTVLKFAEFWDLHAYDVVFCLGDRYEMSAAVQAGIPFNICFAHLYGGESTLGAIDNIYRHQITLASSYHFTATEQYAERVAQITGNTHNVHTVGSLSLDGLSNLALRSEEDLREIYGIAGDFGLVTFHPETVAPENNTIYAAEMYKALEEISSFLSLVITMPNADTQGNVYRLQLQQLQERYAGRITLVEHMGKINYFSAMKYAQLLIGNTSSGIIEAASFEKYVVNVGERQRGRATSGNVVHADFDHRDMVQDVRDILKKGSYKGPNIYHLAGAAGKIMDILKEIKK